MDDLTTQKLEFIETLAKDVSSEGLVVASLPDVTIRIRNCLEDPNVSVDRVTKLASAEPVLASQILRLANSAMYRHSGPEVADLARAISRVGFQVVRNAAIMFGMKQLMFAKAVAPHRQYLQALWEHSVRVAAISRIVSLNTRTLNPDAAMLGGLMHDIGKFYVVMRAKDYPALFANEEALAEIAQEWHTGIGRALLESWELPEAMAVAADEHENLERDPKRTVPDLADIVLVANLLSHSGEGGRYAGVAWAELPSYRRLGINEGKLQAIIEASEVEAQDAVRALGG